MLLHAFNFGVKNNCTTIEHIYNESVNLIECYDVAFDINDRSNRFVTVPVIGMEDMVARARPRSARNHFTPHI